MEHSYIYVVLVNARNKLATYEIAAFIFTVNYRTLSLLKIIISMHNNIKNMKVFVEDALGCDTIRHVYLD